MFKFDFDLDDIELGTDLTPVVDLSEECTSSSTSQEQPAAHKIFAEHSLIDLLAQLPPEISYSPLNIVPRKGDDIEINIPRRDLFDARFQLIASTSPENPSGVDSPSLTDLEYVEAPSDLVPGVYEGGLKTWECSVDLATMLRSQLSINASNCQRILELGCGTAVPSLNILQTIFSAAPVPGRRIALHLQDYNDLVFRLVTLPNAILVWYMSLASQPFRKASEIERNSTSTSKVKASNVTIVPFGDPAEEDTEDRDVLPSADPTQSGDLPLPPALLSAFQQSLSEYGIELRFFSGSWQSFDLAAASTTGKYDTVITSETIYRTDSLGALLDLMWRACTGKEEIEQPLEQLTDEKLNIDIKDQNSPSSYLCLVAAKQVYFGVGGGVAEFIQAVETGLPTTRARPKGRVETIWRLDEGVKRSVMRVEWQR